MSDLRIFTDGACSQNTGAGGWAFVIDNRHQSVERYGPSKGPTTNNRMELTAILGALLELSAGPSITVYTDSAYAKGALSHWWRNWAHSGWKTKDGKEVKNRQLIERILGEVVRLGNNVTFVHVERNSCPQMVRADQLAKLGKSEFKGQVTA
jgi:ribonuclease HI